VVGVDGGASKTVALIGTVEGKILGRGETGSSNYHNVGSTVASNVTDSRTAERMFGDLCEVQESYTATLAGTYAFPRSTSYLKSSR
jgi:N-acetylglucosamine kinase-like BadF-type ATPase